jgi:nicotinate-nucleotide adenylyltransferase
MGQPVVIFGGTFNPVHIGHLIVARGVAEQLGAGRITLMPAHSPPHKVDGTLEAPHRLAMLRLAVEGDGLFEVSTRELDRSGRSYTFDTLTELRAEHGPGADLVWVIGLDMLLDLPNWHRATDVVDLARIVSAARPPMPADLPARLKALHGRFSDAQVQRLAQDVLLTPLIDISSTDIRRRVQQGRPIRYLTPPAVEEYILAEELYRGGGADEKTT